jgi:mRNA-decapping enzyme subunit 2
MNEVAEHKAVKSNKYYMVAPFLGPLKRWIRDQKKDDKSKKTQHTSDHPQMQILKHEREEQVTEDEPFTDTELPREPVPGMSLMGFLGQPDPEPQMPQLEDRRSRQMAASHVYAPFGIPDPYYNQHGQLLASHAPPIPPKPVDNDHQRLLTMLRTPGTTSTKYHSPQGPPNMSFHPQAEQKSLPQDQISLHHGQNNHQPKPLTSCQPSMFTPDTVVQNNIQPPQNSLRHPSLFSPEIVMQQPQSTAPYSALPETVPGTIKDQQSRNPHQTTLLDLFKSPASPPEQLAKQPAPLTFHAEPSVKPINDHQTSLLAMFKTPAPPSQIPTTGSSPGPATLFELSSHQSPALVGQLPPSVSASATSTKQKVPDSSYRISMPPSPMTPRENQPIASPPKTQAMPQNFRPQILQRPQQSTQPPFPQVVQQPRILQRPQQPPDIAQKQTPRTVLPLPPPKSDSRQDQPAEHKQALLGLFATKLAPAPSLPSPGVAHPTEHKRALLDLFNTKADTPVPSPPGMTPSGYSAVDSQGVSRHHSIVSPIISPPPVAGSLAQALAGELASLNIDTNGRPLIQRQDSLVSASSVGRNGSPTVVQTPISPADKGFLMGYLANVAKNGGL